MALKTPLQTDISSDLLDAVRSLSVQRTIEHCGRELRVNTFDFYAKCPECGTRVKLRGFSASPELPDLMEAFFEWAKVAANLAAMKERQAQLEVTEE